MKIRGTGTQTLPSRLLMLFLIELLVKDKVEKIAIVSFHCPVLEEMFFYF